MYTVGIVGLGHVARHQMAALELSSRFRLVAGCDKDDRALDLLRPPVRKFKAFEEMLALPEPEVVVIASPNRLHVEHGIAAMEAGKWVVMEKPLAETREEFERFDEAKSRLGGKCTFALHAAHGLEVEWFCREGTGNAGRELVGFDARFYDPYFENGRLVPSARSLGGSWIDSGINALSVICRFVSPPDLDIRDSRMTRVAESGCREVQGTVDFRIGAAGRGNGGIDTNWTLGRNHKSTLLEFAGPGGKYLLDHSGQRVLRCDPQGSNVEFACGNDRPRLTNHYIGVFAEVAAQIERDTDNFEYGRALHELLYSAEER